MPRWIFALLTLALSVAAFIACTSLDLKHALHTQGPKHPWFHIVPFAVFALLLMMSFRKLSFSLLSVALLFALAWGTEYREHLNDNSPIERADVALDMLGIALGTVPGFFTRRHVRNGPRRVSLPDPA